MSDPVNQATVDLIKRNEGCRLEAYQDSVSVWTIGYGHTGPDVSEGLRITQEQAEELLRKDLERFQDGIDDAIGGDTSDNQYGAMVSLAFNIGLGNLRHSSVLRLHNAGDKAGAADAFLLWNKAGGRVLSGLDRRRQEERTLYLTPDATV
jgi:lysozyme